LAAKEQELAEVLSREAEVRAEKTVSEIEQRALREDPVFLETMARDRLDYSKPGERVLRIQREK
jgi:cell division protein FtsB